MLCCVHAWVLTYNVWVGLSVPMLGQRGWHGTDSHDVHRHQSVVTGTQEQNLTDGPSPSRSWLEYDEVTFMIQPPTCPGLPRELWDNRTAVPPAVDRGSGCSAHLPEAVTPLDRPGEPTARLAVGLQLLVCTRWPQCRERDLLRGSAGPGTSEVGPLCERARSPQGHTPLVSLGAPISPAGERTAVPSGPL